MTVPWAALDVGEADYASAGLPPEYPRSSPLSAPPPCLQPARLAVGERGLLRAVQQGEVFDRLADFREA